MLRQRALLLALILAASPFPAVAESGDFAGLVDIGGGRKMYLECRLTEVLKIYPDIERADADRSFDQLLSAPPLQPMPLIVLSADRPWGPLVAGLIADGRLPADIPPDVGYVTDRAQKEAQAKLAALVPGARHVTNTNSGHEIHKDQPQLVIDSIRDIVDAVRGGKTSLAP